jgi:hypothetical protein
MQSFRTRRNQPVRGAFDYSHAVSLPRLLLDHKQAAFDHLAARRRDLYGSGVTDRGIATGAMLEEMRGADPPICYLLEQQLLSKPWHAGAGPSP